MEYVLRNFLPAANNRKYPPHFTIRRTLLACPRPHPLNCVGGRYAIGARLGGVTGMFKLVSVSGGIPCLKCFTQSTSDAFNDDPEFEKMLAQLDETPVFDVEEYNSQLSPRTEPRDSEPLEERTTEAQPRGDSRSRRPKSAAAYERPKTAPKQRRQRPASASATPTPPPPMRASESFDEIFARLSAKDKSTRGSMRKLAMKPLSSNSVYSWCSTVSLPMNGNKSDEADSENGDDTTDVPPVVELPLNQAQATSDLSSVVQDETRHRLQDAFHEARRRASVEAFDHAILGHAEDDDFDAANSEEELSVADQLDENATPSNFDLHEHESVPKVPGVEDRAFATGKTNISDAPETTEVAQNHVQNGEDDFLTGLQLNTATNDLAAGAEPKENQPDDTTREDDGGNLQDVVDAATPMPSEDSVHLENSPPTQTRESVPSDVVVENTVPTRTNDSVPPIAAPVACTTPVADNNDATESPTSEPALDLDTDDSDFGSDGDLEIDAAGDVEFNETSQTSRVEPREPLVDPYSMHVNEPLEVSVQEVNDTSEHESAQPPLYMDDQGAKKNLLNHDPLSAQHSFPADNQFELSSLPSQDGTSRDEVVPESELTISDPIPVYYQCIQDFDPHEDMDLGMRIGDFILVTGQVDENWLVGRIDDREGIFPASFAVPYVDETAQHAEHPDELTADDFDVNNVEFDIGEQAHGGDPNEVHYEKMPAVSEVDSAIETAYRGEDTELVELFDASFLDGVDPPASNRLNDTFGDEADLMSSNLSNVSVDMKEVLASLRAEVEQAVQRHASAENETVG